MLGFFIAGCAEGDKSSSVVNPNPNVFSPTGSISGVVFDTCKLAPVSGAVVSVAYGGRVHSVTTGTTGAFSFASVPSNSDDGYNVTCDLTKVTGYGYALVNEVYVDYSDLADGTNLDLDETGIIRTESGSGASTPVNNLAATTEFDVGPLASSISGTIYDVSTGRAVTGATVSLFLGSSFIATTTASATGTYSFANIMPGESYYLMVTKAGYDYAKFQAANTVTAPSGTPATGKPGIAGCNLVEVSCTVGCAEALANVNVNLIANPAKDITVPYIVSVATGGETDVINGDVFTDLTPASITSLVATFSEGMASNRTLKGTAVSFTAIGTVVVTSAGPAPAAGASTKTFVSNTLISDYTVTMTSAGVMTVTPTLKTAADWAAQLAPTSNTGTANPAVAWGSGATFKYTTDSTWTLTLTPSPQLTDLSFIPWYAASDKIGALGTHTLDNGFLHAFGEGYQDVFIFSTTPATGVGVMAITVGF
jgi:hypothetical protein